MQENFILTLVDSMYPALDLFYFFGRGEILLVQDDAIREGDLFDGLVDRSVLFFLVQMLNDVLQVDEADDCVEREDASAKVEMGWTSKQKKFEFWRLNSKKQTNKQKTIKQTLFLRPCRRSG